MSNFSEWLNKHFKHGIPKVPPIISDSTEIEGPNASLVSEAELTAGQKAVREVLDESGYGSFVSDEQTLSLATKILVAAAKVRNT